MKRVCFWCGCEAEVIAEHKGWYVPPAGWFVGEDGEYEDTRIIDACSLVCIEAIERARALEREFAAERNRAYRQADPWKVAERVMAAKHGAGWRLLLKHLAEGPTR